MKLDSLDLIHLIHPKTFQAIEDILNHTKKPIHKSLQGQIIKVYLTNIPYHTLFFFLEDKVVIRFITDSSADSEGISPDLTIEIKNYSLASFFLLSYEDFTLFRLDTISTSGNRKILTPFKKYIDSSEITTTHLDTLLSSIDKKLQKNLRDNIEEIRKIELEKIDFLKEKLSKIKSEKIKDMASFTDNFQVISQRLGVIDRHLLGVQARQIIMHNNFEYKLKKMQDSLKSLLE